MPIALRTEADLDTLLTSITDDTATAAIHWRLAKDIGSAVPAWPREFSQAWAFWSLTIGAHRDVTLFRLGRVYDQTHGTLSLRSLLGTIKANLHLFDEPSFRRRLKGNPFVDSLASDAKRPNATVLTTDAASVHKANPLVGRLVAVRNKVLAHRDPKVVLGASQDPAKGLTPADVDALIARAKTIVNRYGILFRAASHSMSIVGHDDFLSILRHVRLALEARERDIARQAERINGRMRSRLTRS